jgi:hypothetical protein
MFSRASCYFFVRPKRKHLEVCIFLGRTLRAPQVKRVDRASRAKTVHIVHITHRDEVEAPITDWLREAYEFSAVAAAKAVKKRARPAQRAVAKGRPAAATRKAKRATKKARRRSPRS